MTADTQQGVQRSQTLSGHLVGTLKFRKTGSDFGVSHDEVVAAAIEMADDDRAGTFEWVYVTHTGATEIGIMFCLRKRLDMTDTNTIIDVLADFFMKKFGAGYKGYSIDTTAPPVKIRLKRGRSADSPSVPRDGGDCRP